MSEHRSLPGPQRAAVLLMALGEHEAAEVLKHMEPKEVQTLGSTMTELKDIHQDQIASVLDDFTSSVSTQSSLSIGSDKFLKNVLDKALGNDRANSVMSRISSETSSKGLEALKWMDPRAIGEIIKNEHPQIIAIVLVYLDHDQASSVIQYLPEEIRSDVIMRIANLDGVHPGALSELDSIMDKHFDGATNANIKVANIGGHKVAANILNKVSGSIGSKIVEQLSELDAEASDKIQEQMFIFESLLDLDDRGLQTLLRDVATDSLILALKGSSIEMQEHVFKNMSKRASEMLRDDLETRGPVRLAEVEGAQKEILIVARKLGEEGKIMLGGGDEFV